MRTLLLALTLCWPFVLDTSAGQAAEAIFYCRQVQGEKRADAAELAKSYYQLESIAVADHRPVPGAAPRVVFGFKHSRRGVSDHGSILNPVLHPTKPIVLFTSDHDQERSLFKSNAFLVGTSGEAYLQLSPYRSNGRWPATGDRTGTVVGRVNGPVAPEGGALVFLEGVAAPAATDTTGRFVFRNVPAGDGLHLVAWKMSLHDPEVVRHYLSDFNFGSASVTVAPGATVQTAVTLVYRGFGYGGQDNSRSYLEYAT
ncbi:carboxypeptidase regulatory-like domain-containing protein [bacterium]|nr:carboxypeptidase regulatory-like domain-containing protein [bacterium]